MPAGQRLTDVDRARIAEAITAGRGTGEIARTLGFAMSTVTRIKREVLGAAMRDDSPAAVQRRLEELRRMAREGYTTRQIAAAIGIKLETCRAWVHRLKIPVPGDTTTGHTQSHKADRILSHIVMDAEHLTSDVELVDFSALDRTKLQAWMRSLQASARRIQALARRLQDEVTEHEQDQQARCARVSAQDPTRPRLVDARARRRDLAASV